VHKAQVEFRSHFSGKKVRLMGREIQYLSFKLHSLGQSWSIIMSLLGTYWGTMEHQPALNIYCGIKFTCCTHMTIHFNYQKIVNKTLTSFVYEIFTFLSCYAAYVLILEQIFIFLLFLFTSIFTKQVTEWLSAVTS